MSRYLRSMRPGTHHKQYAYSAWGPQFAERMKLSATQGNIIVREEDIGIRVEKTETFRVMQATSACMLLAFPWA